MYYKRGELYVPTVVNRVVMFVNMPNVCIPKLSTCTKMEINFCLD